MNNQDRSEWLSAVEDCIVEFLANNSSGSIDFRKLDITGNFEVGCTFLLVALPFLAVVNDGVGVGMGVGLLMLGFLSLGGAVHSFLNSRGGW